jgi:hypothetical protein
MAKVDRVLKLKLWNKNDAISSITKATADRRGADGGGPERSGVHRGGEAGDHVMETSTTSPARNCRVSPSLALSHMTFGAACEHGAGRLVLLLQEILRHHCPHTTGAMEFRGHDGHMKHGEHDVSHVRVSVGQTSGAAQRCQTLGRARESLIRRPTGIKKGTADENNNCIHPPCIDPVQRPVAGSVHR